MDWQGRQRVGVPGCPVGGGPGHRWAFKHLKEKDSCHYFRNGRWEREEECGREERREERRD